MAKSLFSLICLFRVKLIFALLICCGQLCIAQRASMIENIAGLSHIIKLGSDNCQSNLHFKAMDSSKILIKVLPQFYLRWWFILLCIAVFGTVSAFIWYFYYKNQFSEKLRQIEFQEKLELERKRISRDLHDNIGAYTTSLIYKVDDMKLKVSNEEEMESLEAIRQNAAFIMSLLRQTIWVLNSRESRLDSFYDNTVNYVKKVLGPEPRLKVKFSEEIENDRLLNSSVAISLFRIVQESFHNIIKHSQATEARISFISKEKISIIITDNGIGIKEGEKMGNGLRNMEERAKEVGYVFRLETGAHGTTIIVTEKE